MENNFSSELAQFMEPTLVIALSEHLNLISENPDDYPHSENISQSDQAFQMADIGFADLEKEFSGRIAEWKLKWKQRFEIEDSARALYVRSLEIQKIANAKERERQGNALYFDTVHLMVGDAQKLLVTLASRAELLQEKIRKTWHKNCPNNAYSKILPAIEASLENTEGKFFSFLRDGLSKTAMQKFLAAFAARFNNVGTDKNNGKEPLSQKPSLDNANGRESATTLNFYFLDFYSMVQKISFGLCRFYSKKWALFARGFALRQNQIPLGIA